MKNKTALMTLSAIMSFRMLGLFMILPVFSVYALHFPNATPTLIGIALGIYGLTQACFQIPFGMLSDRIGRKRVIFAGLLIFFIGSIVAACASSIYLLIVGRALQGAGAIGSTVLALVADITPEESRGKAMAFIGLSIGLSFTVAMIIGPVIAHYFQLKGIFWFTAVLALCGAGLVVFKIPSMPRERFIAPTPVGASLQPAALFNSQLLKLDFGIFSLHAILTALFIVIPIILTKQLLLSSSEQIVLYLIILVLAFAIALPFIIIAEKYRKIKMVFVSAVAVIFFVLCCLFAHANAYAFSVHNVAKPNVTIFALLLLAFFAAFTVLEALLPSMVSKSVPPTHKGTAMGVYSTCQFLGIFVGGAAGGMVFAYFGMMGVFVMCAGMAVSWLLIVVAR